MKDIASEITFLKNICNSDLFYNLFLPASVCELHFPLKRWHNEAFPVTRTA